MGNIENKLDEILENVSAVKEVVVDKLKEKKLTPKQKAESKFKRVGTKLNEFDLVKFEDRLSELGLNQSQYIKLLIDEDMNKVHICKRVYNLLYSKLFKK